MKSGDLAEIQAWFQQKHGQYFTGSICVVKEGSVLRSCKFYGLISTFICIYGIPLWGTASNSNIEILQTYQNKVLRATVNAQWYIYIYIYISQSHICILKGTNN
jgi:hypothetical protein